MKEKFNYKAALIYMAVFAATILYSELVLRFIIDGKFEARHLTFLLFVPAEAILFSALAGIGKEKLNRILLPIVVFILSFYYIAQTVYYKNFGSLFSVSMIGMGGEALNNFGWALKDTILNSIGGIFAMLVPFAAVIVLEVCKVLKCGRTGYGMRLVSLAAAVAFWFLAVLCLPLFGTGHQSPYYAYHNSLSDTDSTAGRLGALTTSGIEAASYYLGIKNDDSTTTYTNVDVSKLSEAEEEEEKVEIKAQINENFDFASLAANETDEDLAALCSYFGEKTPTYTNEYTGMFEGYNLIYICAESFWSYAVNEKVTPTLYKMANSGIVLNNYYNSFKNTTTNGEYAFATGMWPDVSRVADDGAGVGSFPQSATKYMPYGIGTLFTAEGAGAYGYHNYRGRYYRRNLSWPNIGLTCKFKDDGMTFSTSWPASDLEMMEQSVDDYINDDQFLAYYMTFSGHGPYTSSNVMYNKNVAEVKERLGDTVLDDQAYGYLAGELELDKAMEYLLERLEEAGELDNTVIVIAGDHFPYNISDEGRDSLAGHEVDASIEKYKSTCIVYNAGMEEPIVSDTYCCNVDIFPTILNLFGISYDSRLMAGRDIFSSGVHRAVLYNQSFISNLVTYNSETGEATWTDAAASYTDEEKEEYLESMITLNESEYAASVKMMNENFYFYVWRNSGLMTQDEITAEEEREATVASKAAQIEEEEAARKAAREAAAQQQEQEAADGAADGADGAVDAGAADAGAADAGAADGAVQQ